MPRRNEKTTKLSLMKTTSYRQVNQYFKNVSTYSQCSGEQETASVTGREALLVFSSTSCIELPVLMQCVNVKFRSCFCHDCESMYHIQKSVSCFGIFCVVRLWAFICGFVVILLHFYVQLALWYAYTPVTSLSRIHSRCFAISSSTSFKSSSVTAWACIEKHELCVPLVVR